MSDNELGAFLRARREAVAPEEVGLPSGTRRRTPGLRRAELATLAGVSIDYLTRLEQGRDRNPSPQVLGALGDTLRLSPAERLLLVRLAKTAGGYICAGSTAPVVEVRPTVRALLDRLEPSPALVRNRLTDVLAFTDGYARLVGPLGILDARPANLARFVFTDPRARSAYPNWDHIADELVAHLKFDSHRADPHTRELVAELTILAGAPFTRRWQASPIALPNRTGMNPLHHPEIGDLLLAFESLELPDADEGQLVVYLPADDATAAALDQLARRQHARVS